MSDWQGWDPSRPPPSGPPPDTEWTRPDAPGARGPASSAAEGAGGPGGPPPSWGQAPPPGWGATPPGYQPGYPPYGYPARQTESTAVVALVLGIASFVVCPVVPAIAAIVVAGNARQKIAASGGWLEGEGMAKAGQILGWINIGLWTVMILVYILIAIVAVSAGAAARPAL